MGTDDNEEREDAEGESAPPPTPISTPPAGDSVSTTDVPVPTPTTNVTDGPVSEHQARDIALDYAVRVAGDTHITCTVRLVHNGIDSWMASFEYGGPLVFLMPGGGGGLASSEPTYDYMSFRISTATGNINSISLRAPHHRRDHPAVHDREDCGVEDPTTS